jgi:hypothetical protein
MFWKTRDIGLPSYSNNLSTLSTQSVTKEIVYSDCQIMELLRANVLVSWKRGLVVVFWSCTRVFWPFGTFGQS